MDIPLIILGTAMIGLGVILTKVQINSYRNGVKDTFGSEIRLLITGIGLIVLGIIIIVKAFR
jgi:hypothetical protein